MTQPEINQDRIDEAVLALMYLTLHDHDGLSGTARVWKSFDWESLSRLHDKDLIFDPVNKAKSVVLTKKGLKRSEPLFYQMFGERD